jgi:hypothetical protein
MYVHRFQNQKSFDLDLVDIRSIDCHTWMFSGVRTPRFESGEVPQSDRRRGSLDSKITVGKIGEMGEWD